MCTSFTDSYVFHFESLYNIKFKGFSWFHYFPSNLSLYNGTFLKSFLPFKELHDSNQFDFEHGHSSKEALLTVTDTLKEDKTVAQTSIFILPHQSSASKYYIVHSILSSFLDNPSMVKLLLLTARNSIIIYQFPPFPQRTSLKTIE